MEYDRVDIQYQRFRMTDTTDFAKIAPIPRGVSLARQLHMTPG
jgi:hypothetical protein